MNLSFNAQAVGATDNWRAREIDEGTALKDEQGNQVWCGA